MKTLEEQLLASGLQVFGCCERISAYGPDLLQNAPLLQDFTAAEADILGASMRLIRAAPGQVMIREGESGGWMMLILKGTVDVTKRVEPAQGDGQQAAVHSRVAVVQRGAVIGEMSMLDSEPRYSSCTAIDAVEAAALGRHEVALLIREHPGVGAKLLVKITQLMAQRLRNSSNQVIRLLQQQKAGAPSLG